MKLRYVDVSKVYRGKDAFGSYYPRYFEIEQEIEATWVHVDSVTDCGTLVFDGLMFHGMNLQSFVEA
jgi:hypothetical protein